MASLNLETISDPYSKIHKFRIISGNTYMPEMILSLLLADYNYSELL